MFLETNSEKSHPRSSSAGGFSCDESEKGHDHLKYSSILELELVQQVPVDGTPCGNSTVGLATVSAASLRASASRNARRSPNR